jgi:non-specific protein-tyrosine kinase
MRQVLNEASAKFDWVIIDTPPVGLLPDANLLATMADGAVLVVDAGRTPLKMVQRAVDALGADRIMGCVLNRVNETFPSPTSDYYRYAQRQ